MKSLKQDLNNFLGKVLLIYRLSKAINAPRSVNDIVQTKRLSSQLIQRYLIPSAQKILPKPDCELDEVSVEIKIPGPVRFNVLDKIHLLYLQSDINDPLVGIFRRFSSQNTAFLDIGSNIGFYSFLYQGMGENNTVYAFEPNPELAPYLKANLNRKTANVFEIALSDETGCIPFFYDEYSTGRGSLERDYFTIEVKVNKDKLDNILDIAQNNFDRFIIKIDVEEHEPQVLRGMRKWLRDEKPKLIYLEARPHTIEEICEIMSRYNYFMLDYDLNLIQGRKFDQVISEIKHLKYTNILFSNAIQGFLSSNFSPNMKI